jgi:acetyl esterase/lipase
MRTLDSEEPGTRVSIAGAPIKLPAKAVERHREPSISWQARWVEWLLRVAVKRRMAPNVDLVALRDHCEDLDRRKFRVPHDVKRTSVQAGGVPCEWLDVPQSRPERVLLYLHGGGFALRFPTLYARFTARVGRALGARVLLVDYRLAPEHPFPAGVDDCLTTYRWLLGQGVAAQDIVIAGDSAGANLTLVTLLGAIGAGLPSPACAFAISPPVDLTIASPSFVDNERSDAAFRLATILLLRGRYVGADRLLDPRVSPLFGDLAGLPPLLLQAGTREMLRDDAVRFADRTRSAGVHVELELWHGMQHCFQLLQFLPESGRAIETIARFVTRHTGWSVPELATPAPQPELAPDMNRGAAVTVAETTRNAP